MALNLLKAGSSMSVLKQHTSLKSFVAQDVSAQNEEGNTPLHYACLNGHVDIVKILMLHGASPSDLNRWERNPEAITICALHIVCTMLHSIFCRWNFAACCHNETCVWCRHSRTPVDEALGRPFQDSVVDVVNSFFKEPLVDMDQMQQEEEVADDEGADDQDLEARAAR